MKKVLAFGASNSKKSINKQLVKYAVKMLQKQGVKAEFEVLDLNDFEMPIYSADREVEVGIPELAHKFLNKISEADAMIISYAEHNGMYSAAYKNIFDWASRINPKVFQNKPMIIFSASPGKGGAGSVMKSAKDSAPHFGADIKGSMSVPSFYDNFDTEKGELTNAELQDEFNKVLKKLFA